VTGVTLFYPDIASFQGAISETGAVAVSAKVTEGTGYVNPFYAQARDQATRLGIVFIPYHFLTAGNASAQADWAYQHAGRLPLMIDFEPEPPRSFPTVGDACVFIDRYRARGGITHLIYFPHWYWQQRGEPDLAPLRGRHMALVSSSYTGYTDRDSGAGWQPYGGMTPQVWQYTDALSFHGQHVDFNAFRGTHGGKQDPASVQATIAEFRNLVTTGSLAGVAPAPGPRPPAPPPSHDWQAAIMATLPALSQGASGPAVHRAQALVNASLVIANAAAKVIREDGQFGPGTTDGVKRVQAAHKMTPDGVVGPRTWAVLITGTVP